jgi:REP element-mobilizing transposase RayT
MVAKGEQLAIAAVVEHVARRTHGGKRAGAGRKAVAGRRRNVAHRAREVHEARHPVHVTLRARGALPSLRSQRIHGMLRGVLLDQRKRRYAGSFQVVEFSIQGDHLHFIVEASGADAHRQLRSGVSGLVIAFAKRLNMMLRRRGKVWADRWHGRELGSPREVRNALVYVFRNVAHHGTRMIGDGVLDQLSSAPRFTGWTHPLLESIFDDRAWPDTPPRTWLLGTGWSTHGGVLLHPREAIRPD